MISHNVFFFIYYFEINTLLLLYKWALRGWESCSNYPIGFIMSKWAAPNVQLGCIRCQQTFPGSFVELLQLC